MVHSFIESSQKEKLIFQHFSLGKPSFPKLGYNLISECWLPNAIANFS